jgi:hypothetical protein
MNKIKLVFIFFAVAFLPPSAINSQEDSQVMDQLTKCLVLFGKKVVSNGGQISFIDVRGTSRDVLYDDFRSIRYNELVLIDDNVLTDREKLHALRKTSGLFCMNGEPEIRACWEI